MELIGSFVNTLKILFLMVILKSSCVKKKKKEKDSRHNVRNSQ